MVRVCEDILGSVKKREFPKCRNNSPLSKEESNKN
jgi:hypothetical protein